MARTFLLVGGTAGMMLGLAAGGFPWWAALMTMLGLTAIFAAKDMPR